MKYSIKSLGIAAMALTAAFSSVLLMLIWSIFPEIDVKTDIFYLALFFTISVLAIWSVFIMLVSKHVNTMLGALSETIQSMIDDNQKNIFSTLDDTVLSKLQSQIIKLSDILKAHSLKQKEDKDNITALISDISHQLKTPLANLNMYNCLLLDEGLGEDKRREFTKNIQNQLEKLNWLMESLIKLSRLEAGSIKLNMQKQPVYQTVLQAISMIALAAEQKDIVITIGEHVGIDLIHDTKWTQEAIFNILDNAVKYSQNHTHISVEVSKYELFCRIDITDSGSGIEEAEINKIFLRFYRGQNAKETEGVGIGLFLSRKLITQQGGYIKVKSTLGKGSIFSIFLPLG